MRCQILSLGQMRCQILSCVTHSLQDSPSLASGQVDRGTGGKTTPDSICPD